MARIRLVAPFLLVAGLAGSVVGCDATVAPRPAPEPEPRLAEIEARIAPVVRGQAPVVQTTAALRVSVPREAGAPLRLVSPRGGASLTLHPEGFGATPAITDGVVTAFPEASPFVDLVYVRTATGVEELRIVRDARPILVTRHRVELGAGLVGLRVRDDRLEAYDERGFVHVHADRPFAEDARGVRRLGSLRVDRDVDRLVLELRVDLQGLVPPIVVDPAWSSAPSLKCPRSGGLAVDLADGRILVAGGFTQPSVTPVTCAEIYDPATNTWTVTGSLLRAPYSGGMVRTPTGKVLFSSGNSSASESPGELFDPATGTWSALASIGTVSGPLPYVVGGKVVVAHFDSFYELDEPGKKLVYKTSGPYRASGAVGAVGGKLLRAGGRDATKRVLSTAELLDPTAWTVTATTPLPERVWAAQLVAGPTGVAYLADGVLASGARSDLVFTFALATATWAARASLPFRARLLALPSDRLLAVSDLDTSTALYAGAKDAWSPSGPLSAARTGPSLVALPDGRAMAFGGATVAGTTSALVELFSPTGLSVACTQDGECQSGFCRDGACCDKACTGACEACNVAGKVGTCSAVTGAPTAGKSCAPFAGCAAGACLTTCTAHTDCVAGRYCEGGSCVAKKPAGTTCTLAASCTSGLCADGVCCDSPCTGQCEACALPGREGTCTAVKGTPVGRPACTGAGTGTACGPVCDGAKRDSCAYLAAGVTPCSKNACAGGVETHASTCDGKGACADAPKACGAYGCGADACKSACGTKADCAAGHLCVSNACVPAPGLGAACTSPDACATGFCTDGVCCGVASCGPGSTCGAKGSEGKCVKQNGIACLAGGECASGLCVDGVCCDGACTGQCEACDVVGLVGKCSPTVGKPHATRPACAAGTKDEPCAERSCDGVERTNCQRKAGGEVTCRAARCDGSTLLPEAVCDGAGACGGATVACGAYACDDKTKACKLACTVDADCATGHRCRDGFCRPATAICTGDGAATVKPDGTTTGCAPYRCKGGECGKGCAASDDCAAGYACGPTGACEPVAGGVAEGGCRFGAPSTGGGAATALLVGMLLARRRRTRAISGAVALLAVGCSSEAAPPLARTTDPLVWTASSETLYSHESGPSLHLLPDGRMLLLGANAHEVWSPTSGKWTAVAVAGPFGAFSTRLSVPGGAVLTFGGENGAFVPSADVHRFDPGADTWTPRASMPWTRKAGLAARLTSGAILYAGGLTGATLVQHKTAAVYDPVANTWTAAADMAETHANGAVVALADGRAWVLGGDTASTEIFAPATRTWSTGPSLTAFRRAPAVTQLADGRVLVAGGEGLTTAEICTIGGGCVPTAGMKGSHVGPFVALPSGLLVVAATGFTDGTSGAEAYDPVTSTWSSAGALGAARQYPALAATNDGRVLLAGGSAAGYPIFDTVVLTPLAKGAVCAGAGECASGACFDGVCCDKRCGGACEACNLAGKVGTCSSVTGAPFVGHATCGAYATCTAGACATSCATEADCTKDSWCSGSTCVARRADGAACAASKECASGACADGVCCNVACGGACEACAEPGSVGTCIAVVGTPRATHPACKDDGVIPVGGTCGLACLGTNRKACELPPAGVTKCSKDACAGGVESHASSCDGLGRCSDVVKTCGAFACGATACKTACSATTDCAAGFVCKGTTCIPAPGLGQPCGVGTPCEGGLFCTDGVCCGVAACAPGLSCGLGVRKGTCTKPDGQVCAGDADCGSGACVDGVCCESSCTGQCQACDVAGSVGKCVAVRGAPHGARLPCSKGATVCEALLCDGSDASRCTSFVGAEVSCRAPRCSGDVEVPAGTCAAGACPKGVARPCAPYRCAADGGACATSCTDESGCAAGFECKAGACVKGSGKRCSDDGLAVVDGEGNRASCAPLRCRAGACLTACASSDDCIGGTACADGVCVAPTAASEDGGCSHTARGSRGAWLALLVGLWLCRTARRGGS